MEILVNIALALFWGLALFAALGCMVILVCHTTGPTEVEKEAEEESRRRMAGRKPRRLTAEETITAAREAERHYIPVLRQPSPPASASPALPAPGSGDQEPTGSTDAGETCLLCNGTGWMVGGRGTPVHCNRCLPFEKVRLDCSTCGGLGTVDETLGGHAFSDLEAPCPDCKP